MAETRKLFATDYGADEWLIFDTLAKAFVSGLQATQPFVYLPKRSLDMGHTRLERIRLGYFGCHTHLSTCREKQEKPSRLPVIYQRVYYAV